jgi:general secretion pathway protein H
VRHANGFTLIEMLVCLVILALVAGLASPLLSRARGDAAIKAASGEFATALREARNEAVATGRPGMVSIDLSARTFRVGTGKVRTLPAGVHLTLVTTTDNRFGDTSGAIRFFPDGSSTGGGLTLVGKALRLDVLVDWLTGRVTIASGTPPTNR